MAVFLKCWEREKAGQIKSPVSIIVYKFYIKQPKDYPEIHPVFLISLIKAKLKNRKYGFEPSQCENSLDFIIPTS